MSILSPRDPFGNLTPENHEEIRKYLKYLRAKKESILRAVNNEFREAKQSRLAGETMFSLDDVEQYTDYLEMETRNQVSTHVGNIINIAALTAGLLLESAQEQGIDLDLNTSAAENQALLEAVDKLSADAMPKTAKKGLGELTSFKDEAKMRRDQITNLENNNKELEGQIEILKNKLSNTETSLSRTAESKNNELRGKMSEMDRLEAELRDSKLESNKRVSDTAQFQSMMKLMKSQAETIKDLKRRLQRYEPDNAKEEDA